MGKRKQVPKKQQKGWGAQPACVAAAAALAAAAAGSALLRFGSASSSSWATAGDAQFAVGAERCNIERVDEAELTFERFREEYWKQRPFVLVRDPARSRRAQQMSDKDELLRARGDEPITLSSFESYPFTNESRVPLRRFVGSMDASDADSWAKDLRYSFQSELGVSAGYEVPGPAKALAQADSDTYKLQFQLAIGGEGSGLGFHWHDDVFAETLHGDRRWFLYPPDRSPTGGFNPRRTSVNWLREVYQSRPANDSLHECTIRPSESLYVPNDWWHSTLSLGEGVSVTIGIVEAKPTLFRAVEAPQFHVASEDWAECVVTAEQTLQKYAQVFIAWSYLGMCNHKLGQHEEAAAALERCVELNPLYAPCRTWLARAQIKLGKMDEAKANLDKAESLSWSDDDDICMTCKDDGKEDQISLVRQASEWLEDEGYDGIGEHVCAALAEAKVEPDKWVPTLAAMKAKKRLSDFVATIYQGLQDAELQMSQPIEE